jgi:hypothetical protein
MFSTKRSRVRALAVAGMVVVAGGVATVSYAASAAEVPAAAADSRAVAIPAIDPTIKPPTGSKVVGAYVVAAGTQNYPCVVADGATTGTYSATSTPEAQLIGTGGRVHHFAGPSWQSERDQSLVTAVKKVGVTPDPTAIPQLLLQVNLHSGTGIMTKVDYINRLYTKGGLTPTSSCTAGQVAKVPYSAVYVFWDAPAV